MGTVSGPSSPHLPACLPCLPHLPACYCLLCAERGGGKPDPVCRPLQPRQTFVHPAGPPCWLFSPHSNLLRTWLPNLHRWVLLILMLSHVRIQFGLRACKTWYTPLPPPPHTHTMPRHTSTTCCDIPCSPSRASFAPQAASGGCRSAL